MAPGVGRRAIGDLLAVGIYSLLPHSHLEVARIAMGSLCVSGH
jgi:hypothetical protein